MTRFFPKDISTLLPELFVRKPGSANAKFVEQEKKSKSKQGLINLKDIRFEKFRNQTKRKR